MLLSERLEPWKVWWRRVLPAKIPEEEGETKAQRTTAERTEICERTPTERRCFVSRTVPAQMHPGEQGFLAEKPSGYYAAKTEEAVAKWQVSAVEARNGTARNLRTRWTSAEPSFRPRVQASQAISPAKGYFGYSSRQKYAKVRTRKIALPAQHEPRRMRWLSRADRRRGTAWG